MRPTELPPGTLVVAGAFGLSGVVHLARPHVFDGLIPRALGDPRPWIYVSGAAELACSAGLVTRQPWAPGASTATLLAIWVGNVEMARRYQRSKRVRPWMKALAWARLPLQVPLIVWAAQSPTS